MELETIFLFSIKENMTNDSFRPLNFTDIYVFIFFVELYLKKYTEWFKSLCALDDQSTKTRKIF
jgi:hypothetical protein